MNRTQKAKRIKRATAHKKQQREKLHIALDEVTRKAKSQKKGPKYIAEQMAKRGYAQKPTGDWGRL